MYTNSLTNKLQELNTLIHTTSSKPKVIALTEVKHKSKWNAVLSEFNIPGYDIYSNNLDSNNRGIIVYVSQDRPRVFPHSRYSGWLLLSSRTDLTLIRTRSVVCL